MRHLLLFDVDGVLVEAHGYLRALQDTVAHVSCQMGVGSHPPTEPEVRAFEAHGLTSEWDSAPACVAALLLARVQQDPDLALSSDWPETLAALGSHPLALSHPDYGALAARIGARLREGGEAAQGVRDVLWAAAQDLPVPQRNAFGILLDALLGVTYDFDRAPITQHFQHLVLGHEGVAATYGIEPLFASPSYLQAYDVPQLAPSMQQRVCELVETPEAGAVIYTARPSLPPVDAGVSARGYSPEAETARALVGLDGLPLIGLGRLAWLALQRGETTAALVKPSPVQALAAIGAALSGEESASLLAALTFYRTETLVAPLSNLGEAVVHVFEDTPGGLRAVRGAVDFLKAAGVPVTWQPYGIAPAGGEKARLMAEMAVPVFPTINDALRALPLQ